TETTTEIIDDISYTKIKKDRDYLLKITTGKFTIPSFFELYYTRKDVFVSTSNIEFFLYKIRRLKNIKKKISTGSSRNNLVERYLEIEKKLNPTAPTSSTKISFSPNIFSSIYSSLIHPEIYFYPTTNILDNPSHLKNLLFTRILIKKEDGYEINPLLLQFNKEYL
ncbi:hypothetical protein NGRA_2294, partial [Nosema granulosis]